MRKLLIILIFLHLVFLFPFLKPGIPLSHDGDGHLARIAAYYSAFQDGQIPPRWAGDLNYRYGTPVLIFNYQLPYYIGTFFHALGFTLSESFKFILSVSFIFSGIGFFLWLSKLVRKEAAYIGALLFGLAPYHFLNTFVRGAMGEMVGLAIIPFIFWQIEKMLHEKKARHILIGGVLYGFLILSHNVTSIMFSPIFLLYFLYRARNKYHLLAFSATILIGILLSAYFWLPSVLEAKFVVGFLAFADLYSSHFPPFSYLIYSPWGFGPDVNAYAALSPQIGIIQLVFVLVGIVSFLIVRKREIGFWLCIFIVSVFLTTSFSEIFWKHILPLRLLEFPWRFTALSSLSAAVIGAYVMHMTKNKKLIYAIVIILVIISFFYTKTDTQIDKGDKYYYLFTGSTVYRRATSTIWTGQDPFKIPRNKIEIISGKGEVDNLLVKSNLHSFEIRAQSNVKILDNTFYFPGWRVTSDNKKIPIEFQDINHRGLITFDVSKGNHKVEVIFGETLVRTVANIISLVSILLLFSLFIFREKMQKLINSL